MCNELFAILQEYIEMKSRCSNTKEEKKKQQHNVLHVQLWGAALPCNTIIGESCMYDSDNHIGVIGDWFLKPSIEGSMLSGFALADIVGSKILKERRQKRKTTTAFTKYSCSEIGSFGSLQQLQDVDDTPSEHTNQLKGVNKRRNRQSKQKRTIRCSPKLQQME